MELGCQSVGVAYVLRSVDVLVLVELEVQMDIRSEDGMHRCSGYIDEPSCMECACIACLRSSCSRSGWCDPRGCAVHVDERSGMCLCWERTGIQTRR